MMTNNKRDEAEIRKIISKPINFEYFFRNLDDPNWFDFVKDLGIFEHIPKPEFIEGEETIQFPDWSPGIYLAKMADKIPNKVSAVLKEMKTDNPNALRYAMDAVLALPVDSSKKLLDVIDKWLDKPYTDIAKYSALDLLKKFTEVKDYHSAVKLVEIILKPRPKSRELLASDYHLDITKESIVEIRKNMPREFLTVIEKRLRSMLAKKDDAQMFSRPAVEEHDQNWKHESLNNFLLDNIRDSISELWQSDKAGTKEIIRGYLQDKDFPIFKRVAIHTIRTCDIDDMAADILKDKNNLFSIEIHHEFFIFAREKFHLLKKEDKIKFIKNILSVKEKDNDHKRYTIGRRLNMLQESLKGDKDLIDYKYLLDEYKHEIDLGDHPDFLIYSSQGWTGPTSPLNKIELEKMLPNDFIEYIKGFEPKGHFSSTPEGLSRIFSEVVQENPGPYVKIANRFSEEKIYPAYVSGFLTGLERATKDGKNFDWEKVLSLMEKLIGRPKEDLQQTGRDSFDFGKNSWIISSMASLLEEGLRKDDRGISKDLFARTKKIIFQIAQDLDPSVKDEEAYGGDNMDFVTYAINTNRGKALHALILYALKYARLVADKRKPSKLEEDVKKFLDLRILEETSPSIQSVFTQYLPNLNYLDSKWLKKKIKDGLLFPTEEDKKEIWKAHMEGLVSFHGPLKPLYGILRDHYRLAIQEYCIDEKEKRDHINRRLTESIMITFWYKLEDLGKDSLVSFFFKKANMNNREHAVSYLGGILERQGIKKEEWGKFRKFWEERTRNAKDTELVGFVDWLKIAPESISELQDLIKPMIPHLYRRFEEDKFLKYLLANVENDSKTTLDLLLALLQVKKSYSSFFLGRGTLKEILIQSRTKENSRAINRCVDLLMKAGMFELKDLAINEKD